MTVRENNFNEGVAIEGNALEEDGIEEGSIEEEEDKAALKTKSENTRLTYHRWPILKGDKPADLLVQQANKVELFYQSQVCQDVRRQCPQHHYRMSQRGVRIRLPMSANDPKRTSICKDSAKRSGLQLSVELTRPADSPGCSIETGSDAGKVFFRASSSAFSRRQYSRSPRLFSP